MKIDRYRDRQSERQTDRDIQTDRDRERQREREAEKILLYITKAVVVFYESVPDDKHSV